MFVCFAYFLCNVLFEKKEEEKTQWAAKIIIPKYTGEWLDNNNCIERDHCSRY